MLPAFDSSIVVILKSPEDNKKYWLKHYSESGKLLHSEDIQNVEYKNQTDIYC